MEVEKWNLRSNLWKKYHQSTRAPTSLSKHLLLSCPGKGVVLKVIFLFSFYFYFLLFIVPICEYVQIALSIRKVIWVSFTTFCEHNAYKKGW